MKYEVKDLNAPSRWNMRIWDDDNGEWLCQSDKDALTYYGFDITGGETTEFQGLPKWHQDRHLIWEQSTGLKDKNGKEVYDGDVLGGDWLECYIAWCNKCKQFQAFTVFGCLSCSGDVHWYEIVEDDGKLEVIGNIHENPELVEGEE